MLVLVICFIVFVIGLVCGIPLAIYLLNRPNSIKPPW